MDQKYPTDQVFIAGVKVSGVQAIREQIAIATKALQHVLSVLEVIDMLLETLVQVVSSNPPIDRNLPRS